jgi:hypothetical protein
MDYFLIDNHLTSDRDDQIAIPANIRSFGDDRIIDRIMQRGCCRDLGNSRSGL